ncbi:MAG: 2-oxo acid dehydrogenase subunit E2 [Pseudomonadota bacterium]|nr:2-oxo acid dehydrogenase subunit E2 [Pseudomonadota bacterium]
MSTLPSSSVSRVFASPLARRLARENNLDLTLISGSGPEGRVIKRDIERVLVKPATNLNTSSTEAQNTTELPDPKLFFSDDEFSLEPISPMLQSIAKRLTAAKSEIPHYYVSIDCHVDEAEKIRARINTALKEKDIAEKLTLNDFIIKAAAEALIQLPEVNVAFAGDHVMRFHNADISVAVALPGGGLITPIIKKAHKKSVREIASEVKELAARAREMRLKPEEYEGGTFSVSNLGMFGISDFTAVINPPQSAILAIGGIEEKYFPGTSGPEIKKVMRVTLSSDHRVINGAEAAKFVATFKSIIEQPFSLLFE